MMLLPLLLSLVVTAPAATLRAPQDPPAPNDAERPAERPEEGSEEGPRRLEAWPEAADRKALKLEVSRLRKARTEEMGSQAHAALVAIGDAAAPELLKALDAERDGEALARVAGVLDEITDARHTRLLAKRFADLRRADARAWCLRRVARFPDDGVREAAEAAFRAADGRERDRDPEEVWAAAACAASAGSALGFEALVADSAENWKEHGELTHLALARLRGPEATRRVAPLLEGDRARKVTGLRLLAACGDAETAVPLVRPFLDETDNSLLVGSINALRGIVDGAPPLGKLSTFEAIERAGKWKARL